MAAKKKADNPAFTGRNVALTEIAQTSGISVAALKQGLRGCARLRLCYPLR